MTFLQTITIFFGAVASLSAALTTVMLIYIFT